MVPEELNKEEALELEQEHTAEEEAREEDTAGEDRGPPRKFSERFRRDSETSARPLTLKGFH